MAEIFFADNNLAKAIAIASMNGSQAMPLLPEPPILVDSDKASFIAGYRHKPA